MTSIARPVGAVWIVKFTPAAFAPLMVTGWFVGVKTNPVLDGVTV